MLYTLQVHYLRPKDSFFNTPGDCVSEFEIIRRPHAFHKAC